VRVESHVSLIKPRVRGRDLARHGSLALAAGRVIALAEAVGAPRLWGWMLSTALDGFRRTLEQLPTAAADQRVGAAVEGAMASVNARRDGLIERFLPDATCLGLYLDGGTAYVATSGNTRVYVQRHAQVPKRITPAEATTGSGRAIRCEHDIEPGDVVLAGSVSAFSTQAIEKVTRVLREDQAPTPQVLATLLTEPAAQTGAGALAIVLRVL
jgi:hypothetical protein